MGINNKKHKIKAMSENKPAEGDGRGCCLKYGESKCCWCIPYGIGMVLLAIIAMLDFLSELRMIIEYYDDHEAIGVTCTILLLPYLIAVILFCMYLCCNTTALTRRRICYAV